MQETVKQDREKYIGGSDIPIIMEISPFKSRFDLLLEKAGYKKDTFEGNVFTEYGNTMESKIREYVSNISGKTFTEGKHITDISDCKDMQIRCHTDGETSDTILEIKTTSQIHENIDEYQLYLVQLLFYMAQTGKDDGILAVYNRPDDLSEEFEPQRLQIFNIKIEEYLDTIEDIRLAISRFLTDLAKVKENPFIKEEELLPAEIPDIASRILAFESQLSYMKDVEKKIKDEKERLKTAMESAGVKKWETPSGYKITLIPDSDDKAVSEESFNAEAFMTDHPKLWTKYMETKTVIKKGKKGYVRITAPKTGGDKA